MTTSGTQETARGFLSLDAAFFLLQTPARMTDETAWHGHLPFARWLVYVLRPRLLVELGVHAGDSYCGFCEAVEHFSAGTKCYGIDHWRGDRQAGFYGDNVFRELGDYHDRQYRHFSTLIRARFEEAVHDFADQSIDLLHLDGLHTYEAASQDFHAWLPKMSSRGVMLFHDVAIRDGDYEVWKLWEEVARDRPHFLFTHSYGLGVLAVGSEIPGPIQWMAGLNREETTHLRSFFDGIGEAIRQRSSAEEGEHHIRDLETRIDTQRRELQARRHVRKTDSEDGPDGSAVFRLSRVFDKLAAGGRLTRTLEQWALRGIVKPARKIVGRIRLRPPGGPRPLSGFKSLRRELRSLAERTRARRVKESFRKSTMAELNEFLASGARLRMPRVFAPKVSIVVILFNQAELTYAALCSLAAEDTVPAEVIIIDNGSTDETRSLLERIDGAVVALNGENHGYLRAVNQAVQLAGGENLLLFNNDAVLRPGSLQRAVETLESDTGIGAVGARIVRLDGTLQEAGCIVWDDGRCSGYLRGEVNSDANEAMFRREVDYCSGAFLLTPRALWREMGGYDDRYMPGYYEDTDYCMRLWERGLRVVYEPFAVIDHYEYGSSPSDEHAIEAMQKPFREFALRHRQALEDRLPSDETNSVRARTWNRQRKRVLVIDDRVPHPSLGRGYPRACRFVQAVQEAGFFVTFYPLRVLHEEWQAVYETLPGEVEVMLGMGPELLEAFLAARQDYYDKIVVSRPHNMEAVKAIHRRRPDILGHADIVYDAEALTTCREVLQRSVKGEQVSSQKAETGIQEELALAEDATDILTVSPGEAARFSAAGYDSVHIVGHALEPTPTPRPFAERQDFLFVGALEEAESPNVDALTWFLVEIFPKIQAKIDRTCNLIVAGELPALRKAATLEQDHLYLFGRVDDLTELYNRCRVFVAPVRYAAGIPYKVHEATAHGLPTVGTQLLAEQLGWSDGEEMLVGQGAAQFAEQCVRLYQDARLWACLRKRGIEAIKEDCAPARFQNTLAAILNCEH